MAHPYGQLRQLTKEALIAEYDRIAQHSDPVGFTFLRDELFRRELQEQNARLERMTGQIRLLTIVITVLTLISTVAVAWEVLRS